MYFLHLFFSSDNGLILSEEQIDTFLIFKNYVFSPCHFLIIKGLHHKVIKRISFLLSLQRKYLNDIENGF